MPALNALGQHPVLLAAATTLFQKNNSSRPSTTSMLRANRNGYTRFRFHRAVLRKNNSLTRLRATSSLASCSA